jgi:MFS-type transporter involved in bile tolerance (Atg22 family)
MAVVNLDPWLGSATNAASGGIHGLLGADLLISAGAIIDYSGTRMFTWIGTPRK